MAFNFEQWLDEKSKDEILFMFKGEVSGNIIADSLDNIETRLEDAPSKVKKKIYNILVECMQNLYHHSASLNEGESNVGKGKFAVCILCRNKVGYHIYTGNFVIEKQKEFLTKHLSHINSLNQDQLKDLYKEILDNQEFSDKGGGGLGMVDIARKSGNALGFNFYNYSPLHSFFSLDININE